MATISIPKVRAAVMALFVAGVLLSPLVMTGCFGKIARQDALLPVMNAAWFSNGVEDDIQEGINRAESSGEITPETADGWRGVAQSVSAAIESEDRTAVAVLLSANWADLRAFAEQGIWERVNRGELSSADFNENGVPDFVESYMERLDNYEATIPVIGQNPAE